MDAEEVLYDPNAIEQEMARVYEHNIRLTWRESRRIASRRVRHAVRDVLRGVRPRLKGYS